MDALNRLSVAQETAAAGDVRDLLEHHFSVMRSSSPPGSCHVMAPDELVDVQACLLTARSAGVLLGLGAIRLIGPDHAEVKSMHTTAAARGRGVGQAILSGLIDHARSIGVTRVSLETGTVDLFASAHALYARNGFVTCPPFGDYVEDPLSLFMTRSV